MLKIDPRTLLARIKEEGTPLIDDDLVTFVWQGKNAPELRADFTDWYQGKPIALENIGPRLWAHQIRLPLDAYLEYAYTMGMERFSDPYNQNRVPNGYGEYNHSFSMPLAQHTDLIRRRRGLPAGSISRHLVDTRGMIAGKKRRIHLYQPPFDDPCPLVVVLDGYDYLRRGRLTVILDNLVAQQRVHPLALALVANGGPARGIEYACSESSLWFLDEIVLPLARENLNLVDIEATPGAYGVIGASLGGMMALYTALRRPEIFGHVLSQSGAFGFHSDENVVFDLVRYLPVQPLKVWMDVGVHDIQPLHTPIRGMFELLRACGYQAEYREHPGGHNFTSWRDEVWRGLENLYPWKVP